MTAFSADSGGFDDKGRGRTRSKPVQICHKCNGEGHIARECTESGSGNYRRNNSRDDENEEYGSRRNNSFGYDRSNSYKDDSYGNEQGFRSSSHKDDSNDTELGYRSNIYKD